MPARVGSGGGRAERGQKAHEGEHEEERARGRLGEGEPVEHLRRHGPADGHERMRGLEEKDRDHHRPEPEEGRLEKW